MTPDLILRKLIVLLTYGTDRCSVSIFSFRKVSEMFCLRNTANKIPKKNDLVMSSEHDWVNSIRECQLIAIYKLPLTVVGRTLIIHHMALSDSKRTPILVIYYCSAVSTLNINTGVYDGR